MDYAILVFSIVSGIGACVSCFIALFIYRRQRRIALFDSRVKVLSEIECFIHDQLINGDWNGDYSLFRRHSTEEVNSLFDESFKEVYARILEKLKHIHALCSDEAIALRHGDIHGREPEEIQKEIWSEKEYIEQLFLIEKTRVMNAIVKI